MFRAFWSTGRGRWEATGGQAFWFNYENASTFPNVPDCSCSISVKHFFCLPVVTRWIKRRLRVWASPLMCVSMCECVYIVRPCGAVCLCAWRCGCVCVCEHLCKVLTVRDVACLLCYDNLVIFCHALSSCVCVWFSRELHPNRDT